MFRSPERLPIQHLVAVIALTAGLAANAGSAAWAPEPTLPPPPDAAGPVQDVIGVVESLDGTEQETREGATVTVALTSDVLFAFDRADLSPAARGRLHRVAEQITADAAGGAVRVEGHTDDQGSDAYNDDLSQRRADTVRRTLEELLVGQSLTFEATGHGEGEPTVPNIVDGEPNEENRAKNRRVEIIYNVGE